MSGCPPRMQGSSTHSCRMQGCGQHDLYGCHHHARQQHARLPGGLAGKPTGPGPISSAEPGKGAKLKQRLNGLNAAETPSPTASTAQH